MSKYKLSDYIDIFINESEDLEPGVHKALVGGVDIPQKHVPTQIMNKVVSKEEAMRINSDGVVTKVKQPHFIGGRQGTTGSQSGYTEGTGQNMIANVSQDNTGPYYNTSTGEFTCAVTGVYQVNFHGFLLTADSTSNYSIQIHLNSHLKQLLHQQLLAQKNQPLVFHWYSSIQSDLLFGMHY